MVSLADVREIVSVTVDCASGACLAMLASDSWVMRYSARPTAGRHPIDRTVGVQRDIEAGANEIIYQTGDFGDSGLGSQLHRAAVEQSDRPADVGHRLAAELLGLFERFDRVVDVAILLQSAAGGGGVQQRDGQRVGDDVVYLAGDAPALVGCGMLGQLRLCLLLLDDQLLLGVHEIADQPTHSDETQIQRDRIEAVQRRRDEQQRYRRCGRQ